MAGLIETEFMTRMKAAMKSRDQAKLNVIRAIRARIGELTKSKGFQGPVDDALYLKTIAAYVKSMTKAHKEFVAAGERGEERAAELAFEIEYLSEFLPKKLDVASTRPLVEAAIAETGANDPKQIGRVMGAVMKTHRDEVDATLVRQIAAELLAE